MRVSAKLLDNVYLHRFDDAQISGVPGLVGKPLKDGDGYQNETVWYDPLSPNPFVAKCMAPVTEDTPALCTRALALNDSVGLVVSFDRSLLSQWRDLDAALDAPLSQIGLDFGD